jgi:hypothetical protein
MKTNSAVGPETLTLRILDARLGPRRLGTVLFSSVNPGISWPQGDEHQNKGGGANDTLSPFFTTTKFNTAVSADVMQPRIDLRLRVSTRFLTSAKHEERGKVFQVVASKPGGGALGSSCDGRSTAIAHARPSSLPASWQSPAREAVERHKWKQLPRSRAPACPDHR